MVIELRVMQFWSEIILVTSNHAYDFSPNCTPLSAITIINLLVVQNLILTSLYRHLETKKIDGHFANKGTLLRYSLSVTEWIIE